MKRILILLLSLLSLTGCAAPKRTADSYRQISMQEAMDMMEKEKNYIILDVRTVAEYESGHIPGAEHFLAKPFRDQDLLDAVAAALEKDALRRAHALRNNALRDCFGTLTKRESEVMTLATSGLMNKQIADRMSISEVTVKIHRGQAMRKMRARTFAELVLMAERLGLSPVEPWALG